MACGPSPGTTSGDAGTGGSTDTSATASSTVEPAPTTTAGDPTTTTTGETTVVTTAVTLSTTDPGTTGGTTGGRDTTGETATDTGGSTDGPLCGEPDAEEVVAGWKLTVDGGPPPESVSAPCAVTSSDVKGKQWDLGLDCTIDGQQRTVELSISRTPESGAALFVGDQRALEYRRQDPFWENEWFAIHPEGNSFLVAVAGIKADHVVPDGMTAQEFFGVDIEVVDGLCEPVFGNPCGPISRLALDMTWSAGNRLIFDGQQGNLTDLGGTVQVWVAHATRPLDDSICDDLPPAWFNVVMTGSFGP